MKSLFPVFGICLLSLVSKEAINGNQDKLSSFKWLIGTWVSITPEGKLMETWLPMNDSLYQAQATLYKKTTETVNLESLQLMRRDNNYYLIPTVGNAQPVEYRITSSTKNSFVAENPAHDFPRKIVYILYKKDSLHAYIEGGAGKRKDYYYGRVKSNPAKPVKK